MEIGREVAISYTISEDVAEAAYTTGRTFTPEPAFAMAPGPDVAYVIICAAGQPEPRAALLAGSSRPSNTAAKDTPDSPRPRMSCWVQREQQIEKTHANLIGMVGDLIRVGAELPDTALAELPASDLGHVPRAGV